MTIRQSTQAQTEPDGTYAWELESQETELAGRAGSPSAKPPAGPKAAKPKPPRASNRALAEVIKLYAEDSNATVLAARRALELAAPTQENPATFDVSLMPAATYDYAARRSEPGWQLKLKVRRGKAAYVIKDVFSLVKAWREGSSVTYGKNLSFIHTPSAFAPQANRLLGALENIFDTRALFDTYAQQGYWYGGMQGYRSAVLSESETICLLDELTGTSIEVVPEKGVALGTYVRTLEVTDGDPQVPIALKRSADGDGFDLHMPRCLDVIACAERLYLFDTQTAWRCTPEFAHDLGPFLVAMCDTVSNGAGVPNRSSKAPTAALHLSSKDAPAFCNTVLPQLKRYISLNVPAELEQLLPPPATFSFKI